MTAENGKEQGKKGIFDFSLVPVIFSLAWPTMLEQFMQTAVQYIDTAMVGSLGTEATAAVGSTSTVSWLVGSAVSAFGIGFLAIISQSLGAGDERRAQRASGQAVFMMLVTGLVLTVLILSLSGFIPRWMQVDEKILDLASTYFFIIYLPMLFRTSTIICGTVLRAAGDTRTPMWVSLAVNGINVVLNYFLIFDTRKVDLLGLKVWIPGAGLGVIGAAAASAAAFTFGGTAMFLALMKNPGISPKGERILPDPEILGPCMRVAIPNMLQRFCTSLGYVVFASMINSLGDVSTAAHTIANTVESTFYIPGYGMQTAAATLTGNAIGARNEKGRKAMSRMIVLIEAAMMILSAAVLFLFAPAFVSLFTKSETVMTLTVTVLRMVALSEPFYGISIVVEGMLQGAGETRQPFVFNTLSMWGVRIGGTALCTLVLGLGLVSAWACMIGNNMLLCLLFVVYYVFFYKAEIK